MWLAADDNFFFFKFMHFIHFAQGLGRGRRRRRPLYSSH